MPAPIVVYGATGYTGRGTVESLLKRGIKPILAARDPVKLDALARELGGGFELRIANVASPETMDNLVEKGEVLINTVGPFQLFGEPVLETVVNKGAHYIDSTGEPAFISKVFEHYGQRANATGSVMLTACGWDYVPGNLAGALAIQRAKGRAKRVDIGYFATGEASGISGGTMASMIGAMMEEGGSFRRGQIIHERNGLRVRGFDVGGKRRDGLSVGGSEHYALPRLANNLRTVNVYLGWMGSLSRPMQMINGLLTAPMRLKPVAEILKFLQPRIAKAAGSGPDADARSRTGSHIVAIAYDSGRRAVAEAHITGVDGYSFTFDILAWSAIQIASGKAKGAGALGPVDAFGLEELTQGCAECGIRLA